MTLAFKTILVAVDFSEPSRRALDYGCHLARMFHAGLRVVHVVETPMPLGSELPLAEVGSTSEQAIDTARRQLAHMLGGVDGDEVVGQVLLGHAAERIVEYARDHDVDLVVMGTHGRRTVAHFIMGSVAERVVRTAPCPVVTLRDTGTRQPLRAEEGAARAS